MEIMPITLPRADARGRLPKQIPGWCPSCEEWRVRELSYDPAQYECVNCNTQYLVEADLIALIQKQVMDCPRFTSIDVEVTVVATRSEGKREVILDWECVDCDHETYFALYNEDLISLRASKKKEAS